VLQRQVQRFHELGDVDGLGQVAEKTRSPSLFDVARHGVGADRQDRDVRRQRIAGENAERRDAADAGQVDVHQDDVGQRRVRDLYALRCVHRGEQTDVGPARQQLADQQQVGRVVIDAENGALLRAVFGGGGRSEVDLIKRQFDGLSSGQLDPEYAADTLRALHANRATHAFDQLFADDQPDARALFETGFLARPIERLKQLRQLVRAQTISCVAKTHAQAVIGAGVGFASRCHF